MLRAVNPIVLEYNQYLKNREIAFGLRSHPPTMIAILDGAIVEARERWQAGFTMRTATGRQVHERFSGHPTLTVDPPSPPEVEVGSVLSRAS